MSADPVGGYILFPSTLARADLITTTLKAMELAPDEWVVRLPDDDGPFLPEEGYPFSTDELPEQALALLAQKKSGVIKGQGTKHPETYWFEPVVEGYPVVTIWYEAWNMYYDKWPGDIDYFARRWLHLCEEGQALFGYFSPFNFMFERHHLEEMVMPAFRSKSTSRLIERMTPSWLLYLGPELAKDWREEQRPSPSPLLISEDLPSGAHFFRASYDVFDASLSVLPIEKRHYT